MAPIRLSRAALIAVVLFLLAAAAATWYWSQPPGGDPLASAQPPYRLGDYSIVIGKSGCFGPCPIYTLHVNPDLSTALEMGGYRVVNGKVQQAVERHHDHISTAQMQALVATLEEGEFWRLASDYSAQVTDLPSRRIEVVTPNRRWQVRVYAVPCASQPLSSWERRILDKDDRVPAVFCQLEDQLDELACQAYERGTLEATAMPEPHVFPLVCS